MQQSRSRLQAADETCLELTPSHVQMWLFVAVTLNHSERTVHSPHELYTKECTQTVDFSAVLLPRGKTQCFGFVAFIMCTGQSSKTLDLST